MTTEIVAEKATSENFSWEILVSGQPYPDLPADLYIPPDALRIFLEIFEGPLDLLLYLIRKNNLDILDIPVAAITKQYVDYIDFMDNMKIEIAAEYLEMAAILTEIKSRMLLPRTKHEEEIEADPRAELVRKLQEYEKIKFAATQLDAIPRKERDLFTVTAKPPDLKLHRVDPDVDLNEILLAFRDVLKRADLQTAHNIERETLSVRERMSIILSKLHDDKFVNFINFFTYEEGRIGVVVTFLAILEMVKEKILELVQSEQFAPIYVRLATC
jgi:segregation and condensation protein A